MDTIDIIATGIVVGGIALFLVIMIIDARNRS